MARPELHHLIPMHRRSVTKCGEPAPTMTAARLALIEQGALTECPDCYPTPRPPVPRGIVPRDHRR